MSALLLSGVFAPVDVELSALAAAPAAALLKSPPDAAEALLEPCCGAEAPLFDEQPHKPAISNTTQPDCKTFMAALPFLENRRILIIPTQPLLSTPDTDESIESFALFRKPQFTMSS